MRKLVCLIVLSSSLAMAQVRVPPLRTIATLDTCTDAQPKLVDVTDALTADSCSVGGGVFDVTCECKDGVWRAVLGGSTGSTDNALLRADGTGGATAQASVDSIDDTTGRFNFPASWSIGPATDYTNYFALVNAAPRLQLQTSAANYQTSIVSMGTQANAAASGVFIGGYTGFPAFNNSTYCFGWGEGTGAHRVYYGSTKFCMNGDNRVGLWSSPATFDVYGMSTDASNYVRASLAATSTDVTLAAETAGTGADNLDIKLSPAGTGVLIAGDTGNATALRFISHAGDGPYDLTIHSGELVFGYGCGDTSNPCTYSYGIFGRDTAVSSDGSYGFDSQGYATSGRTPGGTTDVKLTRLGAGSVVLGNGNTSAAPTAAVINATGGSGTDIAGASLTLAGGKGTGTGAPGAVNISTSTVGTTGTTLQTLSARVTVTAGGGVILVPLASPPETCDAGHEGEMYSDTSHALCWCDGTTWTKLAGAGTCA